MGELILNASHSGITAGITESALLENKNAQIHALYLSQAEGTHRWLGYTGRKEKLNYA